MLTRFLLLTGLLTLLLLLPAEQTIAQEPGRFGIVDSFTNPVEATAAGATWTRIFLRWDVIQPGGPSDWKPANVPDPLLAAEVAAGREVVAVLIGTPPWATESGSSTAVPPREFWGDFVFKVASQYQGRVSRWVIWNQPDVTDPTQANYTWAGDEVAYYELLKEAYLKIKAVDPTMQVHLAGLTPMSEAGRSPYLTRLLEVIQADPEAAANNYFFDAVNYHIYYDPLQIRAVLSGVRGMLNQAGLPHKPIWLTETNAPPANDFLETLTSTPIFNVTVEEQRAFVVQAFAMALAGGAERVAFYKMSTQPTDVLPYGLLRSDGSRRPAFEAFQTVSTHFADAQAVEWQTLGDLHWVTLNRGTQTTTVLWNMGRIPTRVVVDAMAATGLLVDDQGHSQPLTPQQGRYTVELPGASCSNGEYCFIGGAPRLLIEAGSETQRTVSRAVQAVAQSSPTTAPLTPTPLLTPTMTATLAPPPTITPTPAANSGGITIPPASQPAAVTAPAVVPPTPLPTAPPSATIAPPAEPIALPDSGPAPFDGAVESVPTPPPVTLTTVLKPYRLMWLFIIGIVVFTVSYGIQVLIWYRLRR